jgi:hypothetical protein
MSGEVSIGPAAVPVVQRITDNNKAERCFVVQDDNGTSIDVTSVADLDTDN